MSLATNAPPDEVVLAGASQTPHPIPEDSAQDISATSPKRSRRKHSKSHRSSQSGKSRYDGYAYYGSNSGCFNRYRVFEVNWPEPQGQGSASNATSDNGIVYPNEAGNIYSKCRKMVVMTCEPPHYSLCLPIRSYQKKGTSKPGVNPQHHSIIYSDEVVPEPTNEEKQAGVKMLVPIRVEVANPIYKLDPQSRINFGEVYTIHHNVKIKPFGAVAQKSQGDFNLQCNEVLRSLLPQYQPPSQSKRGKGALITPVQSPSSGPSASQSALLAHDDTPIPATAGTATDATMSAASERPCVSTDSRAAGAASSTTQVPMRHANAKWPSKRRAMSRASEGFGAGEEAAHTNAGAEAMR